MDMKPTIRKMTSKEEMEQVAKIEQAVWGSEPTPTHQLFTSAKNGGVLIGAFVGEEAVGFQYSFAGFDGSRTYLCSHMLGILPEYRHAGLGADMKRYQAQLAREIGYDWVQWTFDPLESRNAYLNVRKLGGIINTYWENCYGEMRDALNAGLPTDRFRLDWWIDSPRVTDGVRQQAVPEEVPYQVSFNAAGLPVLEVGGQTATGEAFVVPVPADFQELKKKDKPLALDWRMKTRDIFTKAFSDGYTLADVRRKDSNINEYILYRNEHIPI